MKHNVAVGQSTLLQLEPSEITLTLKLLYRLFYFEPDAALLAEVQASELLPYWQEKLGDDSRVLRGYLAQENVTQNNVIDELQADHLALFVGIGMPLAPPWGSVYLGEENLLLQETTYEWMAFLKQQKLKFVLDEKQPQDHIGLMLSVLATLWQQYQQAQSVGGDVESPRRAMRIVLSEYLLAWEGRFCQLLCENAQTPVYHLAGKMTRAIINTLVSELQVTRGTYKLFY